MNYPERAISLITLGVKILNNMNHFQLTTTEFQVTIRIQKLQTEISWHLTWKPLGKQDAEELATLSRIREKFYWRFMKESTRTFINECESVNKVYSFEIQWKCKWISPKCISTFWNHAIEYFYSRIIKVPSNSQQFLKMRASAYPLASGISIADNRLIFFSHHDIPNLFVTDNSTGFKNSWSQNF